MKIFITGVSGFLGSHTAEELARRGHSLTGLVRTTSKTEPLKNLDIKLVHGAFPDCGRLTNIIEEADVIIHIAGIIKAVSKNDFFKVNSDGTHNLVNQVLQARKKPKLFIYVSTIAVNNPKENPDFCLESENCRPVSHYGESKRLGELALKPLKDKVRTVILRPPALYGPRDAEFLTMFKAINHGIVPLFKDGQNRFSVCYIVDVARAIADLVESPPNSDEIFCLDDGKIHTWKTVASIIAMVLNRKVKFIPIPESVFYLVAGLSEGWAKLQKKPNILTPNKIKEMRQKNWVCGYEKLKEYLNWNPSMEISEGFQETLQYYLQEGLLPNRG